MITIKAIMHQLLKTEKNVWIFIPATDKDLEGCVKALDYWNLEEEIPAEYSEFLKISNGFAWNGIEFWGTKHYVNKEDPKGWELMDIAAIGFSYDHHGFEYGVGDVVYLGRDDMETFVFNLNDNKYEIRSLTENLTAIHESFTHFEELFIHVVGRKLGFT